MKGFFIVFLLAFALQASAQSSIPGVDTLLIETVYTDTSGIEHTEPIKTVRIVTPSRHGTTTMYYSVDPKVLEGRVRRRIFYFKGSSPL